MSRAASALDQWQSDLGEMQRRARELEAQARKANEAANQAQNNPDLQLANRTFPDQQSLRIAQNLLENAERQLKDAANSCAEIQQQAEKLLAQHTETAERIAGLLRKALELAPEEPGMIGKALEDIGDAITDAVNDAVDLGKEALQQITDFMEDNANLIAKLSDVVGDVGDVVGAVSDFLPPPVGPVVGAVSTGLDAVALGGHLTASHFGADVPSESLSIDIVGVGADVIPGLPDAATRGFATGLLVGQGTVDLIDDNAGATFFDNMDTYWQPRNAEQREMLAWWSDAGARAGVGAAGAGAASIGIAFQNAAADGIAADNAGQAERDQQRTEDRVWQ
ncbi:MAG: hypothetical protein GEU98_06970 [Pseudonocardiaceae bacterium]|nr:hypothetical protein [Pseudonocardiaceae bacterium]